MQYMGSKRLIAPHILPIILKGRKPGQPNGVYCKLTVNFSVIVYRLGIVYYYYIYRH